MYFFRTNPTFPGYLHVGKGRVYPNKYRKTFYRGGIGMYALPIPRREIKTRVTEDEGFVQEIVTTIDTVETGYSIPFNQKNIDNKHCEITLLFL